MITSSSFCFSFFPSFLQFSLWTTWTCRTQRERRFLGLRTSRRTTPESWGPTSSSPSSIFVLRATKVETWEGPAFLFTSTVITKNSVLICNYPPLLDPTRAPPTQTNPPQEEDHTVSDRRRRHIVPAAPLPVAVVIVYKSLGKLLPERYDPDRRSLR